MAMHAARPDSSPRLRRVLEVLRDGQEHSTRELVDEARVMAVNSCIAELRQNGYQIDCRARKTEGGERYYTYRLLPRQSDLWAAHGADVARSLVDSA